MPKKKVKKEKKQKKKEEKDSPEKKTEKGQKKQPKESVEIAPVELNLAEEEKKEKKPKLKVKCMLTEQKVIADGCDEARLLYDQSRYGHIDDSGRLQISLLEALYLMEKGKIEVFEKNKKQDFESFVKKAKKAEPNFWIRYCVFKDMRNRGYIIKTALKFGADFRVYDRGIKPGEDHARWIIYPVHEATTITWYEFSAKNRVAHSTKKRLMIGVVDDEGDVTYWEIRWMRP